MRLWLGFTATCYQQEEFGQEFASVTAPERGCALFFLLVFFTDVAVKICHQLSLTPSRALAWEASVLPVPLHPTQKAQRDPAAATRA